MLSDSPEGAAVPTLGLSNKAVYEGQQNISEERHVKDEYPESSYFVPVNMKGLLYFKCAVVVLFR